MNFENILDKSKQLTSQMTGIYELSVSGFSHTDLTEMVGLALNLCSSLCSDIQNNTNEPTDFSSRTKSEAIKYNFMPLNSFAARLKMALVHTKTTQAALAWAINVSQGTISQIVTGKVKEAGIVRTTAIAEALGVRANWLLYGEGEMYSKQPESLESQIARLKFSGSNS